MNGIRGSLSRCVWVSIAAALAAQLACGGEEEMDTETSSTGPDSMRFGCVFETSLIDTCNNPGGSPWTEGCVDVLTEEDCTEATQESSEMVGDCEFTTTYRNVMTTPGMACPAEETTGPMENEGAALGEECTVLSDCAMGLCIPQYYCTLSCTAAADCDGDFPSGCCISEGSLGYCISAEDCDALCPIENSSPVGLPTVCECDMGFEWNADFTACDPV